MKAAIPVAVMYLILAACTLGKEVEGKPRVWLDATGKHWSVATLIGCDPPKGPPKSVRLLLLDGTDKIVAFDKLSEHDRKYVVKWSLPRKPDKDLRIDPDRDSQKDPDKDFRIDPKKGITPDGEFLPLPDNRLENGIGGDDRSAELRKWSDNVRWFKRVVRVANEVAHDNGCDPPFDSVRAEKELSNHMILIVTDVVLSRDHDLQYHLYHGLLDSYRNFAGNTAELTIRDENGRIIAHGSVVDGSPTIWWD